MPAADEPTTVLVVEDEPLVRLLLGEVLSEGGFKVVEAANGAEALTTLSADIRVRVMLSDVDMPGLSGFELATEVTRRWPAIEILIFSGRRWPAPGDLPAGAAFLEKPVPNEVLVSHVNAALNRAAARRSDAGCDDRTVIPFPRTVGP